MAWFLGALATVLSVLPAIFYILKAAGPPIVRGIGNLGRMGAFGARLASWLSKNRAARALLSAGAVLGMSMGLTMVGKVGMDMMVGAGSAPGTTSGTISTVLSSEALQVVGWVAYGTKIHIALQALWIVASNLIVLRIYKAFTRAVYRTAGMAGAAWGSARGAQSI